jgi:predicted flavoprotein YhiN
LPDRLATALAERLGADSPLDEQRDSQLREIEAKLANWPFQPDGTEGFAKAEVTVGGVSTDGLSSKTMAARHLPGLYFVGEAVDVTGWLGGYNFQWAWASGWAAAQDIEPS